MQARAAPIPPGGGPFARGWVTKVPQLPGVGILWASLLWHRALPLPDYGWHALEWQHTNVLLPLKEASSDVHVEIHRTRTAYSSSGEWRAHQTVQSPPAAASVVGYDEGHIGDGPGTQPSPWISGPLVYDEDVQSLRFSAWASASGSDMTAEAGTVDAAVTLDWSLAWSSSAGCPQPAGFEHYLLTKALAYAGHENEAGSTSVTCSASGGGSASATASASGTSGQCDPGTGQNWPRISSVSVTCPSSGTVTLTQALAASAIRGSGAGTGQTSAWTQYSDLLYTVEPRIVLDHSTSHVHIDGLQPLP